MRALFRGFALAACAALVVGSFAYALEDAPSTEPSAPADAGLARPVASEPATDAVLPDQDAQRWRLTPEMARRVEEALNQRRDVVLRQKPGTQWWEVRELGPVGGRYVPGSAEQTSAP